MSWNVDRTHSAVRFSIRHLMFAKVHGRFADYDARVDLDGDALKGVEADIRVASIDTAEAQRDNHLRSADFFDVETHPTMRYVSTKVTPAGEGRWKVDGDLTIRGVTKPVTLDVEGLGTAKDPWGNQRVAYEAKTSIDRRDFGLTWNAALETGGVLVGERVEIALEVQAILAKAQAA